MVHGHEKRCESGRSEFFQWESMFQSVLTSPCAEDLFFRLVFHMIGFDLI